MLYISEDEKIAIIAAIEEDMQNFLPFDLFCSIDDLDDEIATSFSLQHEWSDNFFNLFEVSDDYDIPYFCCGATKLVLFPIGKNYVIKIPINCCGRFKNRLPLKGIPFYDFCIKEQIFYEKAKDCGLENFFLETKEIGRICSVPIYAQEKATKIGPDKDFESFSKKWLTPDEFDNENDFINWFYCYCDGEESGNGVSSKIKTLIDSSDSDWQDLSPYFIAEIAEKYGEDKLMALEEFFLNNDIDDLHDANVGYLYDRPVFVDYSSV